jgi:hypothetical protein
VASDIVQYVGTAFELIMTVLALGEENQRNWMICSKRSVMNTLPAMKPDTECGEGFTIQSVEGFTSN